MKKIILLIILLLGPSFVYAQSEDSIEVFILESYIPPEDVNVLVLTFFTSEDCKSQIIIGQNDAVDVTDEFTSDHSARIDISELDLQGEYIDCVILVEDEAGKITRSEVFEVDAPTVFTEEEGSDITACLILFTGGMVYALPTVEYVNIDGDAYFGTSWEMPVLSIFAGSLTYPIGYFSAEYEHVWNIQSMNLFRIGYKHIIEMPIIEFVSPGVAGFTNFLGYNGVSGEFSIGLFNVYNIFTVFAKGRYNFMPSNTDMNHYDLSIGLFTSFFTFRL